MFQMQMLLQPMIDNTTYLNIERDIVYKYGALSTDNDYIMY